MRIPLKETHAETDFNSTSMLPSNNNINADENKVKVCIYVLKAGTKIETYKTILLV